MPEHNDSSSLSHHQVWLEAHLALGKVEVSQGFTLGWRERSAFINSYLAEHLPPSPSQPPGNQNTIQ